MAIVAMKKLRLAVLRNRRDELLEQLLRAGCLEVTELPAQSEESLLRRERAEVPVARTNQSTLQKALEVLDVYLPAKSSLLARRPEVESASVLNPDALESDILLAERLLSLDEKIRNCEAELAARRGDLALLKPWEALDYPLDSAGTKCTACLFGSVWSNNDDRAMRMALSEVTDATQMLLVSENEEQRFYFVLCMNYEREAVLASLCANGFEPAVFPAVKGTAREAVYALQKQIKALETKRNKLTGELTANTAARQELQLGLDRMSVELERLEAVERMQGTETVLFLQGWCPAEKESELTELLKSCECAWEFSEPSEEEIPDVPVKLKNNKFSRALNMVTNMYSLPAYDGVDPNPLMAPFFILFYGMMMADMGYGLLMLIGAFVVLKLMRPRESMRDFGDLLLYCGISTFIFGALTGGFFGDIIPQIAMMINPETTLTSLPHLFTPLEDTMSILIVALAFGVVQTFTGMTVSVVRKCKQGEAWSAVFDEVAWWLILIGIGLMALKVGHVAGYPVVLLLGCADLVIGQFVMKKSIPGGLVGILVAIYNGSTGFFSDILSYSRLMALMLSGSIIATVFNTLGAIPGNIPCLILISVLGNALNFALNILGCYVHDLRLQCLEFFGRFYKDGGRAFAPIGLNTKYVDIIKEET